MPSDLVNPEMLRAIMDMGQGSEGVLDPMAERGAQQLAAERRPPPSLSENQILRRRARESWERALREAGGGEQFIDQALAERLREAMRTSPAAQASTPPEFESPNFPPWSWERGVDPTEEDLSYMRNMGRGIPTPWEVAGDAGTSREWEADPRYDRPPVDPIQGIRVGAGNWPQYGWRPSPHAYRNLAGDEPMPGERPPPAELLSPGENFPSYMEEEIPYSQRRGPRGESLHFGGMRSPTGTLAAGEAMRSPDPGRAAQVEQLMRDLEEQQALEARLQAMGR